MFFHFVFYRMDLFVSVWFYRQISSKSHLSHCCHKWHEVLWKFSQRICLFFSKVNCFLYSAAFDTVFFLFLAYFRVYWHSHHCEFRFFFFYTSYNFRCSPFGFVFDWKSCPLETLNASTLHKWNKVSSGKRMRQTCKNHITKSWTIWSTWKSVGYWCSRYSWSWSLQTRRGFCVRSTKRHGKSYWDVSRNSRKDDASMTPINTRWWWSRADMTSIFWFDPPRFGCKKSFYRKAYF